ncbi:MAG: GGDEF domain-containing protein [Halioglobus sp.]|nr:GGDEF domain-containing protein [Halioglobus sp.]
MSIDDQLGRMTDNALQRGIGFFTLFAAPTVLVSIWRGVQGEWQPVFTVQLLLLGALVTVLLLSRRIPRNVIGVTLIVLAMIAALGGLLTFGSIAPAGHWFLAIALFYAGLLFAGRGMVASALILLTLVVAVAALHVNGYVTPAVPAADFAVASSNWLIELMCAAVFIAIVLPTQRNFVDASRRWMEENEARRAEIERLAMHDRLTGLPLLRLARDRLQVACSRQQRQNKFVAVLFIDLDGFKPVNDRYGHEAGDTILRTIAARLTDRLREGDTVARVGGDEFVVILEEISDAALAQRLATALIESVGQPVEFAGNQLQVGASIGVALYPDHGEDPESLLRGADQAMYRAKRAGRNRVVFAEGASEQGQRSAWQRPDAADVAGATSSEDEAGMLEQLSTRVVDLCIMVMAATITIALVANIWRVIYSQSAPNMGGALLAFALSMALLLMRARLALAFKLGLVCLVGLVLGLPGLFTAGLAGPAVGWGLATSLFLVGAFFDWRLSMAFVAVVLGAIGLAGLGFTSGLLVHDFDVNEQAAHASKWLVFILAACAFGGILLATWYSYKKTIYRLVEASLRQSEQLERLATIDDVTGLPLLRVADDRMEMACKRARRAQGRIAVMLIDLDGFKAVNDSFGHDVGNVCLREVGQRLSANLRESDTVARIGGDEFLVVMEPATSFEQVGATASRLVAAVSRPMEDGGQEFGVSASVGIALYPDDGATPAELRQCADAAMYEAKRAGKNRYQFGSAASAA